MFFRGRLASSPPMPPSTPALVLDFEEIHRRDTLSLLSSKFPVYLFLLFSKPLWRVRERNRYEVSFGAGRWPASGSLRDGISSSKKGGGNSRKRNKVSRPPPPSASADIESSIQNVSYKPLYFFLLGAWLQPQEKAALASPYILTVVRFSGLLHLFSKLYLVK